MQWTNTATPTFNATPNADGSPAVAETFALIDCDGDTVVRFIKDASGLISFELGGVTVASSADYTPETLTAFLSANVDMYDGVAQVETTTVVAAAGCTGNGNLIVTITGANITGSPLDVTVPLTTDQNTAALVAEEIKVALDAAITADGYTVTRSTADIICTDDTKRANDATLNIDINADHESTTATGITNDATSTNTTAGVATSIAATMTALDLSVTLQAGATYEITFKAPAESATKGCLFDFGGGTATATNFVGDWTWTESAAPTNALGARVTALATDFGPAGADGTAGNYVFFGTIEVNAGGTFIPRVCQNAAHVSTTSVLRGATLKAVKVS